MYLDPKSRLGSHLRQGLLATLLALPMLLAACGGGDADGGGQAPLPPPAVAKLTTISVSMPAASIGVGQVQTAVAEGRDQNGVVMTGVSFSWASSNVSVASVRDGDVAGLMAGAAEITAASGGVTSNPAPLTVFVVAVGRVLIDKSSVFLPAIGEAAQLSAQVLDSSGATVAGAVRWVSTAPDKVSVDGSGRLQAAAIGSAQVFAESGGFRSAPTLVFVAVPQPGALLVTDAQVVSVGPPLGVGSGGPPAAGTEYEVTLQGVAAPAPGTVMLGAESAPVAGKVVATRQDATGLVVTLALAPLYELVSAYDIDWTIELSAYPIEVAPARTAAAARGPVWTHSMHRQQRARAAGARRLADSALKPFQAFECDASLAPTFVIPKVQLAPMIDLKLVLTARPGYSKHVLIGSATLGGSAGLVLQAGFKAEGKCEAAGQIKIQVGWLSFVVMPAVRFGLGASLDGELRVVQGEIGVEGKIGFNPVLGWECGGVPASCQSFNAINEVNELKTKSRFPTANGMQAKINGQFYILAGLDASLLLGLANAKILEARVGPKQSFDLAFENDQAERREYASLYGLDLEGVVEPGSALKAAIKKVIDDDTVSVSFGAGFSKKLSESPKGSLSVSKARVAVGKEVDFTVALDDATLNYDLIGYNVERVELWRKKSDEDKFIYWKTMDLLASNSNRAFYRWTTAAEDVGQYEFAAFVNTMITPLPLLEINPESIKRVEVSCFTAGAPAAGKSRARAMAATGQQRGSAHAADRCELVWDGTVDTTVTTTIEGSGTVKMESSAQVRFEIDETAKGGPQQVYAIRSGNFTYQSRYDSTSRHPPCRAIATGSGSIRPKARFDDLGDGASSGSIGTFESDDGKRQYVAGGVLTFTTLTIVDNCNDRNADVTSTAPMSSVVIWVPQEGALFDIKLDGTSMQESTSIQVGPETRSSTWNLSAKSR